MKRSVIECLIAAGYPVAFFDLKETCGSCSSAAASEVLVIKTECGPMALFFCKDCSTAAIHGLRRAGRGRDAEHN